MRQLLRLLEAVYPGTDAAGSPQRRRPRHHLGDARRALGPPYHGLSEGAGLEVGVLLGGRDEAQGPQYEKKV